MFAPICFFGVYFEPFFGISHVRRRMLFSIERLCKLCVDIDKDNTWWPRQKSHIWTFKKQHKGKNGSPNNAYEWFIIFYMCNLILMDGYVRYYFISYCLLKEITATWKFYRARVFSRPAICYLYIMYLIIRHELAHVTVIVLHRCWCLRLTHSVTIMVFTVHNIICDIWMDVVFSLWVCGYGERISYILHNNGNMLLNIIIKIPSAFPTPTLHPLFYFVNRPCCGTHYTIYNLLLAVWHTIAEYFPCHFFRFDLRNCDLHNRIKSLMFGIVDSICSSGVIAKLPSVSMHSTFAAGSLMSMCSVSLNAMKKMWISGFIHHSSHPSLFLLLCQKRHIDFKVFHQYLLVRTRVYPQHPIITRTWCLVE